MATKFKNDKAMYKIKYVSIFSDDGNTLPVLTKIFFYNFYLYHISTIACSFSDHGRAT